MQDRGAKRRGNIRPLFRGLDWNAVFSCMIYILFNKKELELFFVWKNKGQKVVHVRYMHTIVLSVFARVFIFVLENVDISKMLTDIKHVCDSFSGVPSVLSIVSYLFLLQKM